MKRGLNTLLWPYIAVTMMNELQQICVACEAIMMAEHIEAYRFIIQFLSKNAPKRTLDDILVVSGDGFFTTDNIKSYLGLNHAHFVQDHYHLFDSTLEKRFGKSIFGTIKQNLLDMANASNETAFNSAYNNAMHVLQHLLTGRNLDAENELDRFKNEKVSYATFRLKSYRGTMGRLGSVASE